MLSFIYFENYVNTHIAYEKPMLRRVKSEISEIQLYELDGASDGHIFNHALLLAGASTAIILYVYIGEQEVLTGALNFFENMLRQNALKKLLVISNRSDRYLEILGKQYNKEIFIASDEDMAIEKIKTFSQQLLL